MKENIKNPFIIFGAPKCGTTALSEYLRENPYVHMSAPKELHFFCDDLNVPGRVLCKNEYFHKLFSSNVQEMSCGEASPLYLISKEAAKNASKVFPDAKIVVMLRPTIDFLISYYQHLYFLGEEDAKSFYKAWSRQEGRKAGTRSYPRGCTEPKRLDYLNVGKLGLHVQRLLNYFPRENVLFVFLDELKTDPREVYLRVLDFLNAKDDERIEFQRINESKMHRVRFLGVLNKKLPTSFVCAVQTIKNFFRLKEFSITRQVAKINTTIGSKSEIDPKFRALLVHEFSADIKLLADLTDRNLDSWCNQ